MNVNDSNPTKTQWKLKPLFFYHILAALLLITLFSPFTKGFWEVIDVAFFKWINGSLKGHPWWQIFWALANHKLADWVEDLFILTFFIAYVRTAHKTLRVRRIGELVFCILYIAAILFFVNRVLFRENIEIPRLSPTLVVDSSVRLSEHIPWMKIKDSASKSFPGDHGTTALLFAASYFILARGRLGILACLYGAFLCLPRLITGAHWFSDIFVGSGAIALIFLSWAFCSPLFQTFVNGWERMFSFKRIKTEVPK